MSKIIHGSKLLLVGIASPTPTGPSTSFHMLVSELDQRDISYEFVNLVSEKYMDRSVGTFGWYRAWEVLVIFLRYLPHLFHGKRTIYLLIGQSLVGFFRDCFLIWSATIFGHRIVAHLKGGNYDSFYVEQPRWLQWFIFETLRRLDTVIVLSPSLKQCFNFLADSTVKIVVVPNGLPISPAYPILPISLNANEPIHLLYLSNMMQSKGYWELLEACRVLKEQGVSFRCDFCGKFISSNDDIVQMTSTEAQAKFLNAIEAWDLAEEVKWWGPVQGEEKINRLKVAHVFILPTRYVNEGQPVSIIEALAFGKVILSTNYRAIPDMVLDGWNGFFVDYAQPTQIASLVEWLWHNPDKLSEMSTHSLTKYEQEFTREKHLEALLHILLDTSTSR